MRSEGPVLETVEAMADWTLALLSAAGVQRAALVGHSMGSLVALEAAARAPEREARRLGRAAAIALKGTAPSAHAAIVLYLTRVSPRS
jgi:pimeloyl-ACP methyl ester carboxylesterase